MKLDSNLDYKDLKLSIQLSLDGFSFYILNLNRIHEILFFKEVGFFQKKHSPQALENAIDRLLRQEKLIDKGFGEIELIHDNNLFALVPNEYFDKTHLVDYLKYGIKLFKSDYITYDSIQKIDAQAVYLPFVNINNYILDNFGEFEYHHASERFLNYCLDTSKDLDRLQCLIQINIRSIEFVAIQNNELLFFNNFETHSREDILYYILFSLEQLEINPNQATIKLSGYIRKNENLIRLLKDYIKEVNLVDDKKLIFKEELDKYKLHRHLLSI